MEVEQLMDGGMGGLVMGVPASGLLAGCLAATGTGDGWVRPQRLLTAQVRALGSCLAWHPGLFRQMASCTAGVTLEFVTDATQVALEVRMDPFPRGSRSMLDAVDATGTFKGPYDGFSCDVDGRHLPTVEPGEKGLVEFALDVDDAPGPGVMRLPGMGGATHRVTIWLPCLTGCELGRVLADGTYVEPVPERDHLVVLGDSISQGFVTGDPALTFPARLARALDLDLVNQGIGGQVFQPGSLKGMSALDRVAAVVVEFGANYRFEACSTSEVRRDVRAYLAEVAATWPDVPTWVMTPLWHSEGVWPTHERSCAADVPQVIRDEAARHPQMRVVEGLPLMDNRTRLMADASDHPNAEACAQVADRLGFAMRALATPEAQRRSKAMALLANSPVEATGIAEVVRRGIGEVVFAEPGCVLVRGDASGQYLWAPDRKLARRVLRTLAIPDDVCLFDAKGAERDVRRLLGARHDYPCHLVVYEGEKRLKIDDRYDLRVIGPEYASAVLAHYSHPEYLYDGEVEEALAAGKFIGAFAEGQLCGFIGEHPEGAMGLLEVFPGHRRFGWALALESAKINATLDKGQVPWAQVWPDNAASLALQTKLGLTVLPAEGMRYLSREEF